MLAISGIYDGKKIKLLEKTPNRKFKVVVTFIEEINDSDIRELLLSGPEMTEEQLNYVQEKRKHFNEWK